MAIDPQPMGLLGFEGFNPTNREGEILLTPMPKVLKWVVDAFPILKVGIEHAISSVC
jgi:hypothetical protein